MASAGSGGPRGLTVVHVITELDRGGAEVMLCRLLERTDRHRFEHTVVSLTDAGTLGPTIRELGVPVQTLGMRRGVPDVRAVWHLARLIRQERPVVLQTWLYHADLVGLIAGRLAGIRAIVWNVRCSDMDMRQYSWSSRLTRRLLSALSAAPAAVIVNSERGRRVHERIGYRPRRWVTIPNGIDLARFQPDPQARERLRKELGLPLSARLIGMVARYDPMKDHATFLRAAAEFLRNGVARGQADLHSVLVGRGVTWGNPPAPGARRGAGASGAPAPAGRARGCRVPAPRAGSGESVVIIWRGMAERGRRGDGVRRALRGHGRRGLGGGSGGGRGGGGTRALWCLPRHVKDSRQRGRRCWPWGRRADALWR